MNTSDIQVSIVICNWNKKDYVLKCIDSVKKQSYASYDLLVVDNASTDGSVEAIKAAYPDVLVLQNEFNKGGAGGFNTGLRYSLEQDKYKYIYLLDNDVILDTDALHHLVKSMEEEPLLGVAGSKLYIMDIPNKLQELGAWIEWDKAYIKPNKKDHYEITPVNEDYEVDYVPACSLLIRTEAVQKAGIMDEQFFIYWDDIEWQHRIGLSGYKVKAVAASKVWHKMGVVQKTSTMTTYYFWRNRLHFFNKYLAPEMRKSSLRIYFEDYFQGIFTCMLYGNKMTARSMYEAVNDAVNGKRGKAGEHQYGPLSPVKNSFVSLIENKKRICFISNEDTNAVETMAKRRYPNLICELWDGGNVSYDEVLLMPCSHVLEEIADINYNQQNLYCVDKYLNVLALDDTGKQLKERYQKARSLFMHDKFENYLKLLEKQR